MNRREDEGENPGKIGRVLWCAPFLGTDFPFFDGSQHVRQVVTESGHQLAGPVEQS